MSNSKTSAPVDKKAAAKATRDANLAKVLDLATSTAQGELGEADNKDVSAEATLTVTSNDGATNDKSGVKAAVSLGVSASSEAVAAKK